MRFPSAGWACSLFLAVLASAPAGEGAAPGVLREAPADRNVLRRSWYACLSGYAYDERNPGLKLPPEELTEVRFGELRLYPDPAMSLLMYKSKAGLARPDRVLVDVERKKDLTHAPVWSFGKPDDEVAAELPGLEPPRAYWAKLDQGHLTLWPQKWYEGTVLLDGKEVRAAFVDPRPEGACKSGVLFLDVTGTGRWEPRELVEGRSFFTLASFNLILGKPYTVRITKAADSVEARIEPFAGETGRFTLDPVALDKLKADSLQFYLHAAKEEPPGMPHFVVQRNELPVSLPTGTYQSTFCYFGAMGVTLNKFSVERGGLTQVPLVAPTPAVSMEQKDRTLTVRCQLVGQVVSYSRLAKLTAAGVAPAGEPQIEVRADGRAEALASGKMQFG